VDRVVVVDQGELKAAGPPEAVIPILSRYGVRPPCYAISGTARVSWLGE